MADNTRGGSESGTAPLVATDEVTYSGDTADVQLLRPVHVTGAEGSRTVTEITSADGLKTTTPNRTASGTLGALNAAVTISCDDAAIVSFYFASSNLVGTVVVDSDLDGSTWNQEFEAWFDAYNGLTATSAANPVAQQELVLSCSRFRRLRLRVSAYTSGSAVVHATTGPELSALNQPLEAVRLYVRGPSQSVNGLVNGGGTEGEALRVTLATDSTGLLSVDDNGGSLTVDGTVTVGTLPALVAGSANIGDVDVLTVPAPLSTTGGGTEATALRVTVASNSTGLLPVSLASVPSHPVTNAGTFATQVDGAALTALQLIDDPVQVLGTDVYTEASSKGITLGAVRRDADTTLVGTTNEFGPLQMDANGRLKVEAFSGEALPVTLTSTTVTAISAGNNNIGDVDVASIAAGDNNIGNVDIVTLPALVAGSANIGDVDVLTVPADPFGVNADAASATGSVSAKLRFIAATGIPVTALPALVAGSANIGDVDVLTVPAPLSTTGGGTEATALRVTLANDSTGLVSVDDNAASLSVDWNGTQPVTGSGTATGALRVELANNGTGVLGTVGAVTSITNAVTTAGGAAHASPVSGNPNLVAGRASTALPTDVGADGDAASLWTNRNGAPVVAVAPHVGLNSDPYNLLHEGAQYTSAQTSAVLVAGGASEKIVVTKVQIQAYATTAGTAILYFGTGAYSRGTNRALFDGEFAPSATLKPGAIFDGPFISGTNGDDLLVTTTNALSITFSVWYYIVT